MYITLFILSHIIVMLFIDIKFKGDNLEKRLSNLYHYSFEIDGMNMNSFEGFIQSLRTPNIDIKKDIWLSSGFIAWKKGQGIDWWSKQEVYWISNPIDRHSSEYTDLITKVYDCIFEQCEDFRKTLEESLPYKLKHTIGKTNKNETLLTNSEFLGQLNRLRNKLTEKRFYNILDLF